MRWVFGTLRDGYRFCANCGDVSAEDEMHLCPGPGGKMPDEENPIKAVEDTHALRDLGKMAYHVFMGAIAEGATFKEAYVVTAAYFRGVIGASEADEEKEDD